MSISAHNNFHRLMLHDDPQRLSLDIRATPPVLDMIEQHKKTRNIIDAFDLDFGYVEPDFEDRSQLWRNAYADLGIDVPENSELEFGGITHLVPPGQASHKAYHLRQLFHPLSVVTSVKQLESLPWPDMTNQSIYANLEQKVSAIHKAGRAAVGYLTRTILESSWYLRGMDNLFVDLFESNGVSDWLLDWFVNRSTRIVTAYCHAGVDIIALGDDVGTQRGMMMSENFWRQHLKGRLKKVIDAVRAHQQRHVYVFYHSDGDIRPIIDDLAEVGVNILNPVQPECMPAAEVVSAHKHHLAFWGLIGTQTTMPFGTPEQVRNAVQECASLVRAGGSIVVAPTHVLEPDVPWENIEALVEEVRSIKL